MVRLERYSAVMSDLFQPPTITYHLTVFLGTRESVSEILHGLFVFPDSRLTQRGEAFLVCFVFGFIVHIKSDT